MPRFRTRIMGNARMFDKIVGYEGIKRTFLRSLNSDEPVHVMLVGPAGHAKTLFLKCILDTFGHTKTFFTVGGNASKSGLIDVLFDMQPNQRISSANRLGEEKRKKEDLGMKSIQNSTD